MVISFVGLWVFFYGTKEKLLHDFFFFIVLFFVSVLLKSRRLSLGDTRVRQSCLVLSQQRLGFLFLPAASFHNNGARLAYLFKGHQAAIEGYSHVNNFLASGGMRNMRADLALPLKSNKAMLLLSSLHMLPLGLGSLSFNYALAQHVAALGQQKFLWANLQQLNATLSVSL